MTEAHPKSQEQRDGMRYGKDEPLVLIAEDSNVLRSLFIKVLEIENLKAVEASTVEEAVRLFNEHPYVSLVISDLDLGSGREDAVKIHTAISDELTRRHGTFIVSSGSPQTDLPAYFKERTVIYLQKPSGIDAIIEVVRMALGDRKKCA